MPQVGGLVPSGSTPQCMASALARARTVSHDQAEHRICVFDYEHDPCDSRQSGADLPDAIATIVGDLNSSTLRRCPQRTPTRQAWARRCALDSYTQSVPTPDWTRQTQPTASVLPLAHVDTATNLARRPLAQGAEPDPNYHTSFAVVRQVVATSKQDMPGSVPARSNSPPRSRAIIGNRPLEAYAVRSPRRPQRQRQRGRAATSFTTGRHAMWITEVVSL